jgi:hypothetical protein
MCHLQPGVVLRRFCSADGCRRRMKNQAAHAHAVKIRPEYYLRDYRSRRCNGHTRKELFTGRYIIYFTIQAEGKPGLFAGCLNRIETTRIRIPEALAFICMLCPFRKACGSPEYDRLCVVINIPHPQRSNGARHPAVKYLMQLL